MRYLIASFTHKNTNIETREKLSFADLDLRKELYDALISIDEVHEALVVSTCNRVEIIVSAKEIKELQEKIMKSLSKITGVSISELDGKGEIYTDAQAIYHIFSVVSSLDSLVLG